VTAWPLVEQLLRHCGKDEALAPRPLAELPGLLERLEPPHRDEVEDEARDFDLGFDPIADAEERQERERGY
jgi:hypothetical protein